VKGGVKRKLPSLRPLVNRAPAIEQRVGIGEYEALAIHSGPFAVDQGMTYIADMAEARPGLLGEFGNLPMTFWVPPGATSQEWLHAHRP